LDGAWAQREHDPPASQRRGPAGSGRITIRNTDEIRMAGLGVREDRKEEQFRKFG
jgi:hypothetical protein